MSKDLPSMLLEEVIKVGKVVSRIETTVNAHGEDITSIKKDVTIIKSDNQGNYSRFIQAKEELENKVNPMWDDYQSRQKTIEENRIEKKKVFFSWVETGGKILVGCFVLYILARMGVDVAEHFKL